MTYSYSQVSQYLTCPRRYRHRYLDGWQEKDTRAAMLFGRAFERALAAYFLRQDAAAALFREWTGCQNQGLQYSNGDTWRKTRLGEFSRLTSFPIAGFASRRIPAATALTLGFASEASRRSKPVSCDAQEQKTLVGLTSLLTRACFINRFWVGHGFSRAVHGPTECGL